MLMGSARLARVPSAGPSYSPNVPSTVPPSRCASNTLLPTSWCASSGRCAAYTDNPASKAALTRLPIIPVSATCGPQKRPWWMISMWHSPPTAASMVACAASTANATRSTLSEPSSCNPLSDESWIAPISR